MTAAWVAAIATAATLLLAVAGWCARWAWRILMRTAQFLDDYFGETARPGVPERPGVMARLQNVETITTAVRDEARMNGGQSLRDVVTQTAADVSKVKDDVASLRGRMELFEQQREIREHTERIETIITGPPRPIEEGTTP